MLPPTYFELPIIILEFSVHQNLLLFAKNIRGMS